MPDLTDGKMLIQRAALCAACLLCASGARAEWILDASFGADYESNLSLSPFPDDVKGDTLFSASVSPGRYFQLSDRTGAVVRARFAGSKFMDIHGLDNFSAGVAGSLRTKLGLGHDAPWVRVDASAIHENFSFDPRDDWRYLLGASAGMRLGRRWSVSAGYSHEWRRADRVLDVPFLVSSFGIRGDAFNVDAHIVSLNGSCEISDRLTAVIGYTFRRGGVTASTERDPKIFEASDAITPDGSYGPDYFAYRIQSSTHVFSAGLSWALNEHASLNAGYDYVDSHADYGLTYANHLAHFNILLSF